MIAIDNKTVTQPYVAVDGEWKEVSAEYAMVNGDWKEVFCLDRTYTINVYRFGTLYQTMTVNGGESVTLPSLGVGYATASDSTDVYYNSGSTIKPRKNMDLYAVFSYSINLYKYGTLYQTLTSKSQETSASFTLPTCSVNSEDNEFYGWTRTSGSTSRTYEANQTITSSGTNLYAVFSYSSTSSSTAVTFDKYRSVNEYPVTVNTDCTVKFTIYNYVSTEYSGETTYDYDILQLLDSETSSIIAASGKTAWLRINGVYQTGTYRKSSSLTVSVSAGTTIEVGGGIGYFSNNGYYLRFYPYIRMSCTDTITTTQYRSTK